MKLFSMIFVMMEFVWFCGIMYQASELLWKIFIALCDSVIKLIKRLVKYVVESIKK